MKTKNILCTLILSLFFIGCEEEFNPKTEFHEKYALFAIVSNSPQVPSTSLTATVLRTYDVDGYDPSVDQNDHSVPGCVITVTINDREVKLVDDSLKIDNPFRSKYFYTLGNIPPMPNQEMKIKAVLPNGKVLTSRTKIPEMLSLLEFSYPFNSGIHTKLNRFIWGDNWIINWDSFNDYLYFPKLVLSYAVRTDSSQKYYTREIPIKYAKKNGKFEPVYPSYTWEKQMEYSFDSIDSVMTQISAGDTAKSTYRILSITFGMLEYESNLASYFSSTNGYLDNFSIRLDETVYSNISGGIGVFGGYTRLGQTFKVERAYVESFGYTWVNF